MKKGLLLFREEIDEEPTVNLTPLIDVVFVVLILFILVAPLVEFDRISLATAGSGKTMDLTSLEKGKELKIQVYRDNTITLNGSPIKLSELEQQLHQLYLYSPELRPQLFHDEEATFGTYQSIKNAVESVGFETLDVILKPG